MDNPDEKISYNRQIHNPLAEVDETNSTPSEDTPWDSNDEFVYDSNYELFYDSEDDLFTNNNRSSTSSSLKETTDALETKASCQGTTTQNAIHCWVKQSPYDPSSLRIQPNAIDITNEDHGNIGTPPIPEQNRPWQQEVTVMDRQTSTPLKEQEYEIIDLTTNKNRQHPFSQEDQPHCSHQVKKTNERIQETSNPLKMEHHHEKNAVTTMQIIQHDDKKLYVCHICKRQYDVPGNLKNHMRLHQGTQFTCTICNKQFIREALLQRHIDTHDATKCVRCDICGQRFTSKARLHLHESKHKHNQISNKSYCERCNRPISQYAKNKHRCRYPFHCNICNKQYRRETNYNNHMNMHLNNPAYECTICEKKYNVHRHFANHLEAHGREEHTCDINIEITKNLQDRKDETEFTCQTCHNRFKRRKEFIDHILTHGMTDPQYCRVCIIYYGSDMTRQHKCLFCKKQYRSRANLREHLNKHTREEFYKCPICHNTYLRKYPLIQHLGTHKHQLLDKCTICSQSFDDKNKLFTHFDAHCKEINKMSHNELLTHNCHICNKSFPTFNFMCDHIQKHLPIQ